MTVEEYLMKKSNGQKEICLLRNKANGEDSQKYQMYEGNKGYRSQYSCKQ